jgi:CheY-like chemotaxis protein
VDGYEATRRIRSIEGDGGRVTIVALTAHATKMDRQECLRAGMDDYMGKPYRLESLELMLRRWLIPLMAEGEAVIRDTTIPTAETADAAGWNEALHDLRNALGGVVGGVELALLRLDDHRRCRSQLETAIESAQRAVVIASTLQSGRDRQQE